MKRKILRFSAACIAAFAVVCGLCFCSSSYVSFSDRLILDNIFAEYYSLAEEYAKLKKYDKAILYYEKLLSVKEYTLQVSYKIARTYALAENWNDSAEMYRQLLENDPQNASIKTSLAYVLAKKGDIEAAAVLYDEIMQIYPYEPNALKNAVLVQALSGNEAKMQELIETFRVTFPLDESIAALEKEAAEIFEKQAAEKNENTADAEIPAAENTDTIPADSITANSPMNNGEEEQETLSETDL
ncbi:MAG: tetratricopeptide repeat protein [Bacteroides sp.]|nr:tetratricopeptide repeat protein [Prevotella sp.]MCM1407285.1 tetratricopeptide repeat protein [Treponema brennaborense]MCM1469773.1 tetratricopeptide repeat protein [Bacteroides sp.]